MSSSNYLQTSRQMTDTNGNIFNALVYSAVHGNGYGLVTESTENYQQKRLSPCVGYWDYPGGSGGGSSGGGSSGGGSSTATSFSIEVNVNTTAKSWIETNYTNNQDKMWFWTQDGHNYELTHTASNSWKWSGTMDKNDEIVGFYITNSSGTGYKDFSVSATHTVTANWVVNYEINNDDVMVLKS